MEEPVEVVREMWDAFARGDGRASLEAFHPDVEWDGRNIPDGVLGRGRQVVLDHARHWSSIWDDWTVEVEKLVQVTPDTVVTYIASEVAARVASRWTSGTPRPTWSGTA